MEDNDKGQSLYMSTQGQSSLNLGLIESANMETEATQDHNWSFESWLLLLSVIILRFIHGAHEWSTFYGQLMYCCTAA